jgi:predicted DsbA family dithiol-disulfide isomerase
MTETMPPPRTIEVYADVVCPFTHVGLRRLFALRDELRPDVPIEVHAWPLELVNDELVASELLVEEVDALRAEIAPELFRGFDARHFPLSSLPALELAARAYRHGMRTGEQVSRAVRDALFEEGRDLRDPVELASVASAAGVDETDDTDRAAVRADFETGRERGVVGSPHFFVDHSGFFCPTLDIERIDGRLAISFDPEGFVAFVTKALGPAADAGE